LRIEGGPGPSITPCRDGSRLIVRKSSRIKVSGAARDNPTGPALPQVPERQRAQWFRAQATDGRSGTRKTMIVALARKLGVEITNRS